MDLEDQGTIKAKSEEMGAGNVVVLLGSPDPDAAEMYAETVTLGDPTYAGPLAGVSLRLPVYFITEPEIKQQIPPDVYRDQVEMMEMVLPSEEIIARVRAVREKAELLSAD
jgi:glycine/sarcosine/betaine reductase complex component A